MDSCSSPAVVLTQSRAVEDGKTESRVAELLEYLMLEGVRVRSYADKDRTLEDVFMLVTKGLVS